MENVKTDETYIMQVVTTDHLDLDFFEKSQHKIPLAQVTNRVAQLSLFLSIKSETRARRHGGNVAHHCP